ncbi:hypothetical protein TraAM80_02902 [Trypanosoma rangeli]|uniref:Uncharacterized protein n=1 Tax=Trypanosoma rangeli TaxID=5698 RepID=A0A3R7NL89_TRYRA|nr:uncharacterized protein TraAM80_02902 [Trypanosoma rangeli]RNF08145.1 hypothetical protein TraAM80_02902 [Trypanosoma rangeli]|eukprot:RNF08145.1 hypothetical protein TraAM80_02902 [Trypanosoma rangeli]
MNPPEEVQQQQRRKRFVSVLLHAPIHQATFFSLTLVEELLRYACKADHEFGLLSIPLAQSRESTRVLSRIVQEKRYEEYWPKEHSAISDPRGSTPSASYLLRIGVLRALGFHTPGLDDLVDDASLALGRDIVVAPSLSEDTASAPLRYREATQEELRHVALGEWCEDLIKFTAYRGFSAEQARCVLLTAMHLMNVVADLPPDTTDEGAERRCAQVLEELLVEQACGLPRKVVETHNSWKTVNSEVQDPQIVAALEVQIAQEKNKKRKSMLREQLKNVPTIPCTRQALQEERLLTEIVVGPYFTLHEVAQILEYFSSSVVRHWRLFRTFLAEPQPVEAHEEVQVQWDVCSFCVPPLMEFLQDDMYAIAQERQSLLDACEEVIRSSFEEEFMQPLLLLQRERDDLLACLRETERQAEEDNIRNALDAPGYARVARSFALRLNKCIERNEAVGKIKADEKPPETTLLTPTHSSQVGPAASSSVGTKRRSMQLRKNSVRGRASGGRVAATPVPSLQPIPNPADAVFSLEEVEARLERLEHAAEEAVVAFRDKSRKKRSH